VHQSSRLSHFLAGICGVALLSASVLAVPATAQMPRVAGTGPRLTTGLGYAYVNTEASSQRFGLHGLSATVTVEISPRLGATADLGYVRASNILNTSRHSDVLSYLFGPVVYPTKRKGIRTYLHALWGGARVTGSVPLNGGGLSLGYVNKAAWALGGGVEYTISPSLSLRVGADYLHTSFFDSSAAIQGRANFRTGVSIVYLLGRRRHP